MSRLFVLSLGGSIVSLKEGLNVDFLKKFKKLIEHRISFGDRFVIVVGGGFLARNSVAESSKINSKSSDKNKDWIGIAATQLNAQIVKAVFSDYSYELLSGDPYKKIITKKSIIFSGGYIPGSSSDLVAVILAKTYKASEILNLSNIDYVYDKDPRFNKDAKKIEKISWGGFLDIVGHSWSPGLNSPFDPIASKMCKKEKKKVVVLNGKNLMNLKKYFSGEKFKGTQIYDWRKKELKKCFY